MSERLAAAIVEAGTAYVGAGLVLAVPLAWAGVRRLDPAAAAATWGFRVVIVPGVVLLWPLLVTRLLRRSAHPPTEVTAHRRAALQRGTR